MRHLGAVGCQPTAFTARNAGYKQQGWREPTAFTARNAGYKQQGWSEHEASGGCRLSTYSIYSQKCGLQTAGLERT